MHIICYIQFSVAENLENHQVLATMIMNLVLFVLLQYEWILKEGADVSTANAEDISVSSIETTYNFRRTDGFLFEATFVRKSNKLIKNW
jgi:hypothetical protein